MFNNPFFSIAVVLWSLMAIMLLMQWAPYFKKIPVGTAIFIFILVIITAPALVISDIVTSFLDLLFPEGWSDSAGGPSHGF